MASTVRFVARPSETEYSVTLSCILREGSSNVSRHQTAKSAYPSPEKSATRYKQSVPELGSAPATALLKTRIDSPSSGHFRIAHVRDAASRKKEESKMSFSHSVQFQCVKTTSGVFGARYVHFTTFHTLNAPSSIFLCDSRS